jgi:deoxycytidylate deaminase
MEKTGIDLNHIYKLRRDFTIIGLTGQTGSGCSDVADQLSKGFGDGKGFNDPLDIFRIDRNRYNHNSFRKQRIIYDYAKVNFKGFTLIRYEDVLTLFLVSHPINDLKNFLVSNELKNELIASKISDYDFSQAIDNIGSLSTEFDALYNTLAAIDLAQIKENGKWKNLFDLFFSEGFRKFSDKIHSFIGKGSDLRGSAKQNESLSYHKTLQVISNNLRRSGDPYKSLALDPERVFSIAEVINSIIKSHREQFKGGKTQIVVNSLKNPLEIMYFKQRYSAFYAVAVNRDEAYHRSYLDGKFTMTIDKNTVYNVIKEEHDGGADSEFFKQNVSECLQQADIHISFLEDDYVNKVNNEQFEKRKLGKGDNASPYFSWRDQLLKFVSLIDHPGLVTPSPEERCMQLAYTAKHNSGCISRHVGAAITDENYSVKAIGWNNTPEGQVPCVLRKADDLINNQIDNDAFTDYEKNGNNLKLRKALEENFSVTEKNKSLLNGRNVCFCFKSLKNSFSEGKNQVHTRSLHAEESAFLQISKYGGVGIKDGKLFSTASPCELCSKKAYQLGIKVIYYIDPYPGISKPHILSAGSNPIDVRLFNGAIGNAYHWLYDPIMPYKDELNLLLGNDIKDLTSQHESDLRLKNKIIQEKDEEIEKLKALLREK